MCISWLCRYQKVYKLYALDSGVVFFSRDVQFCEDVFPFKISKDSSIDVSHNVNKFINSFPFFDDHVVYDENCLTSEGNGQNRLCEIATDTSCQDAFPDGVLDHSNTGEHTAIDSGLPRTDLVPLVTRQSASET